MTMVFLLLAQLAILYLLSRALTKKLFGLFQLVFRARTIAITLISLLHFPGTVVHELSHMFTAEVLGVRSGRLSLVPEILRDPISKADGQVQMGSVMIAHTDPFRRYAIGLAPIVVGMILLTALSSFLPQLFTDVFQSGLPLFSNLNTLYLILNTYFLFSISNAMFSSKEDLKGFIPFLIVLGLFIGGAYAVGLRVGLTGAALEAVQRVLTTLSQALGLVLGINIILLVATVGGLGVLHKLFRRPTPRTH